MEPARWIALLGITLAVLVTQSFGEKCGTIQFNPSALFCCEDKLYARPAHHPACCGNLGYDSRYFLCCSKSLVRKTSNSLMCCGKEVYDTKNAECDEKNEEIVTYPEETMATIKECCDRKNPKKKTKCCHEIAFTTGYFPICCQEDEKEEVSSHENKAKHTQNIITNDNDLLQGDQPVEPIADESAEYSSGANSLELKKQESANSNTGRENSHSKSLCCHVKEIAAKARCCALEAQNTGQPPSCCTGRSRPICCHSNFGFECCARQIGDPMCCKSPPTTESPRYIEETVKPRSRTSGGNNIDNKVPTLRNGQNRRNCCRSQHPHRWCCPEMAGDTNELTLPWCCQENSNSKPSCCRDPVVKASCCDSGKDERAPFSSSVREIPAPNLVEEEYDTYQAAPAPDKYLPAANQPERALPVCCTAANPNPPTCCYARDIDPYCCEQRAPQPQNQWPALQNQQSGARCCSTLEKGLRPRCCFKRPPISESCCLNAQEFRVVTSEIGSNTCCSTLEKGRRPKCCFKRPPLDPYCCSNLGEQIRPPVATAYPPQAAACCTTLEKGVRPRCCFNRPPIPASCCYGYGRGDTAEFRVETQVLPSCCNPQNPNQPRCCREPNPDESCCYQRQDDATCCSSLEKGLRPRCCFKRPPIPASCCAGLNYAEFSANVREIPPPRELFSNNACCSTLEKGFRPKCCFARPPLDPYCCLDAQEQVAVTQTIFPIDGTSCCTSLEKGMRPRCCFERPPIRSDCCYGRGDTAEFVANIRTIPPPVREQVGMPRCCTDLEKGVRPRCCFNRPPIEDSCCYGIRYPNTQEFSASLREISGTGCCTSLEKGLRPRCCFDRPPISPTCCASVHDEGIPNRIKPLPPCCSTNFRDKPPCCLNPNVDESCCDSIFQLPAVPYCCSNSYNGPRPLCCLDAIVHPACCDDVQAQAGAAALEVTSPDCCTRLEKGVRPKCCFESIPITAECCAMISGGKKSISDPRFECCDEKNRYRPTCCNDSPREPQCCNIVTEALPSCCRPDNPDRPRCCYKGDVDESCCAGQDSRSRSRPRIQAFQDSTTLPCCDHSNRVRPDCCFESPVNPACCRYEFSVQGDSPAVSVANNKSIDNNKEMPECCTGTKPHPQCCQDLDKYPNCCKDKNTLQSDDTDIPTLKTTTVTTTEKTTTTEAPKKHTTESPRKERRHRHHKHDSNRKNHHKKKDCSQPYDDYTHICCDNVLRRRIGISPACCGKSAYDTVLFQCCSGKVRRSCARNYTPLKTIWGPEV